MNSHLSLLPNFLRHFLYMVLILISVHQTTASHASPDIDACVDLLRNIHKPSLEDFVEQKRNKLYKLVVGEENGRIVTSTNIINAQESFDDVMGIRSLSGQTLTREERLEVSRGLFAPIPELLTTIKKIYPILKLQDSGLQKSLNSVTFREKNYSLDTAINAYTTFNDYHNALSDTLRQLVIACESLRILMPEQSQEKNFHQLLLIEQSYDSISRHLINIETASAHHIVFQSNAFHDPYNNLEAQMTPENLHSLITSRDFDRYLMTFFLYERLYSELDALRIDLDL